MTGIRSRKPTGVVPYPLVLVEGEEKAGKSWAALTLSRSPRVGQTYVIDLGEGGADEYGRIPGVRYEIIEHDGTWAQITEQILAVKAEAARAKQAGEAPVVLVIDSATDLWNGLKAWVDERYRRSEPGKKAIARDPDGELKPTQNLWNDANGRHRRLMTQLMTFPGIVVLTARGKEVSEVRNGKPVEGSKVWSVEAQRDVPFDASVWLRMFRTSRPVVVGARSVHVGLRPGDDDPQPIEGEHENLLDWLIFDVLKVDPGAAAVRNLQHTTGGELTDTERADEEELQQRAERPDTRPPSRQPPAQRRQERHAHQNPDEEQVQAQRIDAARKIAVEAATRPSRDTLLATYTATKNLHPIDVRPALTDEQLDFVTIPDGHAVPLGDWLKACGNHAREQGMSVNDAIALDPTSTKTPIDEETPA